MIEREKKKIHLRETRVERHVCFFRAQRAVLRFPFESERECVKACRHRRGWSSAGSIFTTGSFARGEEEVAVILTATASIFKEQRGSGKAPHETAAPPTPTRRGAASGDDSRRRARLIALRKNDKVEYLVIRVEKSIGFQK